MRDRCYVGKDNLRDNVWIRGGYAEIAHMLGLQRPKTISEWLPPVFEQKAIPRPPQSEIQVEIQSMNIVLDYAPISDR